ncbi:DUF4440 domain-containing protein [Lysobacter sp. TY2-98]|uniref:nuclear transport factor 2 family protein n=1 Tax=Lysobacter sp. TY2-98 TaxID=2290922 RepID=UPI001F077B3C|nr:DUF4440 domain-containing protein [Lysobacter sp. TY2-98]
MSTPPDDVLAALIAREPLFHRTEFGTSRTDFERMIVEDFWETGASGRRYDRAFVLDELERRYAGGGYEDEWHCEGFRCRALGADTYLLTYTLHQGARVTRRMTLWRRDTDGWRAVYHQGTILQEDV